MTSAVGTGCPSSYHHLNSDSVACTGKNRPLPFQNHLALRIYIYIFQCNNFASSIKPAGHRSSNCDARSFFLSVSKMASSTFLPFLSPSREGERGSLHREARSNSVIEGNLDRSSSSPFQPYYIVRRNLSLSLSVPASGEILFVRDLMPSLSTSCPSPLFPSFERGSRLSSSRVIEIFNDRW